MQSHTTNLVPSGTDLIVGTSFEGDQNSPNAPVKAAFDATAAENLKRDAEAQRGTAERQIVADKAKEVVAKIPDNLEKAMQKAILNAKINPKEEGFKNKVLSVLKNVGVATLKGVAAYAVPKLVSTVVSGAPALLGLCEEIVDDPVSGSLYAKALANSMSETPIQEQVLIDRWAGVRSLIHTMDQGTLITQRTSMITPALTGFALGLVGRALTDSAGGNYQLGASTWYSTKRLDPAPVPETRYMFVQWAERYTEMFAGVDPGPILRDARQQVDFYDLSVTVGAIKMLLGEPTKVKFSAVEPLLKLFMCTLQYYAMPVGNEVSYLPGTYLVPTDGQPAVIVPFPFTNANANFPINAFATTLSRWMSYLSASQAVPNAVFNAVERYGSDIAVVPITQAMYQQPAAMAWWTLAFLEYPWTSLNLLCNYTDRNGRVVKNDVNGDVGAFWFPESSRTFIPGPKQNVLYVLIDANIDDAAQLQLPTNAGNAIIGYNGANGVNIEAYLSNYCLPAAANLTGSPQALNMAIKWWRQLFGSADDWRDAFLAAATNSCHLFMSQTIGNPAGNVADNVWWPHVLLNVGGNNVGLAVPMSSLPVGRTAAPFVKLPADDSKSRASGSRFDPLGDPCSRLIAGNATIRDSDPRTSLTYPQYSHSLGPLVASKLWKPLHGVSDAMSFNSSQLYYSMTKTGMYLAGLFDFIRGNKGFPLVALSTSAISQAAPLAQLYVKLVDHVLHDLFGSGLHAVLGGCYLARNQWEMNGLGDQTASKRQTTARLLPTSIISCLAQIDISNFDQIDIPRDGERVLMADAIGTISGFRFDFKPTRKALFTENYYEYNVFGQQANDNALMFDEDGVLSWSTIYNLRSRHFIRYFDVDLRGLYAHWANLPLLYFKQQTFLSNNLTTLPIGAYIYMTYYTVGGIAYYPVETKMVLQNNLAEIGSKIRFRDKLLTSTNGSTRVVPYSAELGGSVSLDSLL